jgi:hypothetical protein
MMTASRIAKELNVPLLKVNHHFCEWMSEKFFDRNHLEDLMIRRPDLYPKEMIIKEYLAGIDYVDEDVGFEESLTYYPESREKFSERNERLMRKICEHYSENHKDKKFLHIIVTHGYHVEVMGTLHGGK